jgi:hypothetical protein
VSVPPDLKIPSQETGRTFLKVYMELVSYFLFLQEQIKDIIIIATNHLPGMLCETH